jgi:hypothetical protein
MAAKTIKLCEGHKGGWQLFKIMGGSTLRYRGTPLTKLKVVVVDKANCVQCKANKRRR